MSACTLLDHCAFFNDKMADMPTTAHIIKTRYCREGKGSACARYLVFEKLGPEKVPHDLFPNQLERVEEVFGF